MKDIESRLSRIAGPPLSVRRRAINRVLLLLPLAWRRRGQYLLAFDRPLHLRRPQLWTEKINWRMVNDRRDLIATTCDKLACKSWVSRVAAPGTLAIPRTVWSGDDPRELAELTWPDLWVLKPNHGTGVVQLGRGRPDPGRLMQLIGLTSRWIAEPGPERWGEWGYGRARRLVVLEEAVPGTPLSGRNDYKFFVTAGTVRTVQVDVDRFARHRRWYCTPEGAPIVMGDGSPVPELPAPPRGWEAMTEIAAKLGALFDAIRVDLYLEDGQPWFGELTAYDGSGLTPFPSSELDLVLGEGWQLPIDTRPGGGTD